MKFSKTAIIVGCICMSGTVFAAVNAPQVKDLPPVSWYVTNTTPFLFPMQLGQGIVAHIQINNIPNTSPGVSASPIIVEWNGVEVCGGQIAPGNSCLLAENGNNTSNSLNITAVGNGATASGNIAVELDPFK